MSFRKSDSFLLPGKVGRKTGFHVTRTPKRGPNGLEDPRDFFLSDDEFETTQMTTTSPSKRLSLRYSKLQEIQKAAASSNNTPTLISESKIDEVENENGNENENESGSGSGNGNGNGNEIANEDEDESISTNLQKLSNIENNGSKFNSDINSDSDMDLDDIIKNAEDIGTPIKVTNRTLTSITGSPRVSTNKALPSLAAIPVSSASASPSASPSASSSASPSSPALTSPHVATTANGSKLTKNIALNKNTKNSKFLSQTITNAEPLAESDIIFNAEKYLNTESTSEKNENDKMIDIQPDESQSIKPLVDKTIPVLQSDDKIVEKNSKDVIENKVDNEKGESENAIPSEEENNQAEENLNISDDTEINSPASPQAQSVSKESKPRGKSITTTEIVEFLASKDKKKKDVVADKNNKGMNIKSSNSGRYSTSQLVTSGSESETSDNDDDDPADDDALVKNKNAIVPTTVKSKSKSKKGGSNISDKSNNPKNIKNIRKGEKSAVTGSTESPSKVSKMIVSSKPKPKQITKQQIMSPVRRSTRTRVPPIKSWKNEKIVYKAEKVNGIVVKTVKDVLHIPENFEMVTPSSQKVVSKGKSKTRKPAKEIVSIDISDSTPVKKATKKKEGTKMQTAKKLPLLKKTKEVAKQKKGSRLEDAEKRDNVTKRTRSLVSPKKKTVAKGVAINSKATPKLSKKVLKRKKNDDGEIPEDNSAVSHVRSKKPKFTTAEKSMFGGDNNMEESSRNGWQNTSEGSLTLSIFEGPGTEKQVERTVAFAPNSYKNVTIIKSDDEYFKVGTLFDQDCEFCGGGVIELPPGAKKAIKSNHDTYFIFYVIVGEIEVTLSRNTFVVTEGCSFEIPMGNYYQFVNTGIVLAKMMFVQAKYIVIGENESSDSNEGSIDSGNDDDDDDDGSDNSSSGSESE